MWALIELGMSYETGGDSEQNLENAIDRYEEALSSDPYNGLAQAHLALALSRLEQQTPDSGRLKRIRSLVDGALRADPELWLAHQAAGKLAYLEKDWKGAEWAARRALGLMSEDDPWGGHTLEWATTSPPPAGNFLEPVGPILSERPLLDAAEPGDTERGEG